MRTSQLKSRVVAIMIVMMIGVVSVQAQDRRDPHPQKDGKEQMQRGDRQGPPQIPGMTEEQREQMKSIHMETEKAALPVKNEIGEKEARLRTLVTSESYDEKSVNKLLDEIGDLKTEVEKLKVASIQQVKEVLTDEQLLAFYKHMDKKDGKPGKGHRSRGR